MFSGWWGTSDEPAAEETKKEDEEELIVEETKQESIPETKDTKFLPDGPQWVNQVIVYGSKRGQLQEDSKLLESVAELLSQ